MLNRYTALGVSTTVVSAATRGVSAGCRVAAVVVDILAESGRCNGVAATGVDEAELAVEDAFRAVESFPFLADGVGFAGGKSTCVSAITISERNSARKKRLSIMEPDHSRLRATDDSEADD